jgi:uncharacterized protein involved in exopolysaccharide biosynthesis
MHVHELSDMSDLGEMKKADDDPQRQIVYLVQAPHASEEQDTIDLMQVARIIWAKRAWIAIFTLLVTASSVAYVLTATQWFRAQAVLIQRDAASGSRLASQLSQLGGLASLAGLSLGSSTSQEPLGTLKSWGFANRFILSNQLVEVLSAPRPLPPDEADRRKSITKLVDKFRRSVLSVAEDRKSGLITVSVRWKDPVVAAEWANKIADQINDELRAKTLEESTRNIKYLQAQLKATDAVSLQQAIGSLLETEMQKLMLAQGTDEYAFRVIDRAQPPAKPVKPRRTALVLTAFVFGLFGSVAASLLAAPVERLVTGLRGSTVGRTD